MSNSEQIIPLNRLHRTMDKESLKEVKEINKQVTETQRKAYDADYSAESSSAFSIGKTYLTSSYNLLRKAVTSDKDKLEQIKREEEYNLKAREILKDNYTPEQRNKDLIDTAFAVGTVIALASGAGVGVAALGLIGRRVGLKVAQKAGEVVAKKAVEGVAAETIKAGAKNATKATVEKEVLKESAKGATKKATEESIKNNVKSKTGKYTEGSIKEAADAIKETSKITKHSNKLLPTKKQFVATGIGSATLASSAAYMRGTTEVKNLKNTICQAETVKLAKEKNPEMSLLDFSKLHGKTMEGEQTELSNDQCNKIVFK